MRFLHINACRTTSKGQSKYLAAPTHPIILQPESPCKSHLVKSWLDAPGTPGRLEAGQGPPQLGLVNCILSQFEFGASDGAGPWREEGLSGACHELRRRAFNSLDIRTGGATQWAPSRTS